MLICELRVYNTLPPEIRAFRPFQSLTPGDPSAVASHTLLRSQSSSSPLSFSSYEALSRPFAQQSLRRGHSLRSSGSAALFSHPLPSRVSGWKSSPTWHAERLLCSAAASEVRASLLKLEKLHPPHTNLHSFFCPHTVCVCVCVCVCVDGARIASSTGIDILLLDDFKLVINDTTHLVRPPRRELMAHEEAERLNDVKFLVQQLYTTLRIEEHQLSKERELIGRLEDLNSQLRPLEKVKEELSKKAERRTTWVLWGGMAYMATQFGILARLTWWEYSWDIMEPVTYFITYGTAMAMYAYFVLTRQEYIYPDARDRQYLLFFHKGVKRTRFDIEKYNQLKDAIAEAELDLKRLRDPLQLNLPIQQISTSKD
uniref:Calcium uniporter protein n=1 Tax=Astyanax mexicanus TaxID=7994 RepID=A0A8B9KC80_ASTMX